MTAALDDQVAGLRRANAELRQQLDEALQRETATAEVLQVINASAGDLTPVFEAILEKAVRICGAAHGSLRIFDGRAFQWVATDGGRHSAENAQRLGPIVPYPGHHMEPLLVGRRFVQLDDAAKPLRTKLTIRCARGWTVPASAVGWRSLSGKMKRCLVQFSCTGKKCGHSRQKK